MTSISGAIRARDELDIDSLESLTGSSLEALTNRAESDPIVRVTEHKDIVD